MKQTRQNSFERRNEMSRDEMKVIFEYTCDQAIEDGVLVHFDSKRYPYLLMTAGVFAKCEERAKKSRRSIEQVVIPLFMDAVMAARSAKVGTDRITLTDTAAGTVLAVPNEKGGMTILNPEDD